MGPYSVKIAYHFTNVGLVLKSYLFRVEAVSANNMEKEIFVYTRTATGVNIFEGVANPHQMLTVPINDPDPESTYPLKFRTAEYETYLTNATEVPETQAGFQTRIDQLVDSLNAAELYEEVTYVQSGILGEAHTTSSFLAV